MRKRKVILTMIYDIKLFPPVVSICNILSDLDYEIVYIGGCTDDGIENYLTQEKYVKMYKISNYGGNSFKRFIQQWRYRNHVLSLLKKEYVEGDTYLWLLHSETVSLFSGLLGKYDVIAHLFEFKNPDEKIAYRLLSPFSSFSTHLKLATKVICCEYNRAHLTKIIYGLSDTPYILPNKPYWMNKDNHSTKLSSKIENLILKYKNRKIILYQGIFIPERRVDYFIDAVKLLPDDYVLFLMGGENSFYKDLKSKYESERIVFLPFLPPPLHLEITKLAHIGILIYIVNSVPINHAINVSYCAPNKLYEYSMFNIPMLANDLPALQMVFLETKAGICVPEMNPQSICTAIETIEKDYSVFSENAGKLYNSIDMPQLVKNILS